MTSAYIVARGRYDDTNGTPLAIFADEQAAEQWAARYEQAHPECSGGSQWVVSVSYATPFIPADGTPPDPDAITT
jgi:hypothetical protein